MARFIPSLADRCLDWSNVVCRLQVLFLPSLNLIFNSKLRVGNLLPVHFLPVLFFFLAQFFPDSRHLIKSTQFDFLFALPYNGYNI